MGTRLAGKAAVITGGASGIGAATAARFVAEGCRVTIADRDLERGEQVAAQLGDDVRFVPTDVSIEQDVAELMATAIDDWGDVDIVFNNAGFGGALGPISQTSVEDFDLTFDVLVKSVFLGMKHIADHMTERGSGSIINTGSIAAIDAGWSPHLYSAAKATVIQLSKTVAMELGDSGVRVNVVCPGAIATPLLVGKPDATDADLDAARVSFAPTVPIGRVGEPADLASMVLFLAGDESTFITGQSFVVDGGSTTGTPWSQWVNFMKQPRPIRHHRPDNR